LEIGVACGVFVEDFAFFAGGEGEVFAVEIDAALAVRVADSVAVVGIVNIKTEGVKKSV